MSNKNIIPPIKFTPIYKEVLWGGDKIAQFKGIKLSSNSIGESWEVSGVNGKETVVAEGEHKGKLLSEIIDIYKADFVGASNYARFGNLFPLLIKFIHADKDLSLQVHPNDEYALKNENSYGKIEMWYILDAEKDAGLYVGFKENQTKESINKMLKEGTINDSLNFFNVKKGDFFIIEPGIVHAIGKGVTLIEIQQNSNITYRLYDYDRVDKNGNKRELHIKKALDVISLEKYIKNETRNNILTENKYFSSYIGNSSIKELKATSNSFITFTIIEGNGYVGNEEIKLGDTFFLPASEKVELKGDFKFIYTTI